MADGAARHDVGRGVIDEDAVARSPADVAQQLRDAADRLMAGWAAAAGGMTGTSKRPAAPALPRLPALPATMTGEQVQKVLDDLTTRRAQVQALRDSLTTFDEQLALLESNLQPVVEWTRTWAALEKSVSEFWRSPGSSGPG